MDHVAALHVRYVSTVSATQLKTLFLTVSVESAAQLKPSDAAAEPRSAGCGRGGAARAVGVGVGGSWRHRGGKRRTLVLYEVSKSLHLR